MDYFLSMLFMLLSSKGNFTAFFDVFYYLIDAIFIYVGVTRRLFKASDFKLFFGVAAAYFIFIIGRYLFLNDLALRFFLSDINFFVQRFVFGFLFCAVLRETTIHYMARVTIDLAAISLVCFFLQLVSPTVVEWVGKIIELPQRVGNPEYSNFIVFTFDALNHPKRNCGFSWEPGAYGCFLDMGLLMHFLTNGFKFDKRCIILIVAIATTLSTTTYIGALIIGLLFLRVNGLKFSSLLFILVPILIVVVIKVPFLFDKIGKTWDDDQEILSKTQALTDWMYKHGGELSLNRFGSMIYLYNTFGVKLWWGVSNSYQDATGISNFLNISNGDADFIAKFGVVGLLYLLYRFTLVIKKFLFKFEYIFYCILLLLALGFGEPFLIFPSIICFVFLPQYTHPELYFGTQDEEIAEEEAYEENYTPVN